MRVSTFSIACILSLPALAAAAEGDLASPNSNVPGLPWLSHVAGSCWRSELSKGETYDRQCFSVQFGKVVRTEQIIESLKDGKVASTLNASSVYAWDPRQQKIRHIFWGSDGSFESATGWIEGDALILYLDRETDAKGNAPARTVLRRQGASGYCASREKRQGSRWVVLFSFSYERDGAAGDGPSARTIKSGDDAARNCAG